MNLQDKNTGFTDSNLPVDTKPDYEKAETDLLKAALQRSHMERLLFATKLYKIQQTLKKAVVTHQPYLPPKSK